VLSLKHKLLDWMTVCYFKEEVAGFPLLLNLIVVNFFDDY
jgi:hypothetical protein